MEARVSRIGTQKEFFMDQSTSIDVREGMSIRVALRKGSNKAYPWIGTLRCAVPMALKPVRCHHSATVEPVFPEGITPAAGVWECTVESIGFLGTTNAVLLTVTAHKNLSVPQIPRPTRSMDEASLATDLGYFSPVSVN